MFDKVMKVVWLVIFVGVTLIAINTWQRVEMAKISQGELNMSQATFQSATDESEAEIPHAECKLRTGEEAEFEMDIKSMEMWMDSPTEFLADLKGAGGYCDVTVPDGYQAMINSSAGNATSLKYGDCRLGNPIECGGRFWILPDQYRLTWGPNNDSAGFMASFRER